MAILPALIVGKAGSIMMMTRGAGPRETNLLASNGRRFMSPDNPLRPDWRRRRHILRLARLIALAAVIAIAALSLAPGVLRPHTFLPPRAEHLFAYAGAGLFLALGYLRLSQRLAAWSALAAASGLFEILQGFVPGRSPNALDAVASMSGLTIGVMFGAAAAGALLAVESALT